MTREAWQIDFTDKDGNLSFSHRLRHRFLSVPGRVVSGTDPRGAWVGFECSMCGKIEGKHYVDRMIDREIEEHSAANHQWHRAARTPK